MSDFDDVLERLLVDPAFKAALATDPSSALAGYRLSADEAELLGSQLSTGDGDNRTVEMRSSKLSMFGLLSPLEGLAAGGAGHPAGEGFTPMGGGGGHPGGSAFQTLGERLGPVLSAPGAAEAGPTGLGAGVAEAFNLPGADGIGADGIGGLGSGGGGAEGLGLSGSVGSGGSEGSGGSGGSGAGESLVTIGSAESGLPTGAAEGAFPGGDHIPVGYHPHVDADGDGRWDHYVSVQHADGSVDIYEDRNHDGLVDFIGHDRNADGIIDSADYDEDFDGVADTHMTDINGDGWMDTRTPIPPPGS